MHATSCWIDVSYAMKALALLTVMTVSAALCPFAAAETAEERSACIGDAFRVCWAAIPNRDDVFHCLLDNRTRLQPDCRAIMDQYRPRHARRLAHRRTKVAD